jgi:transposase
MNEGAFSAVGADGDAVPASEVQALQGQIRELQRLLGKKSVEAEILREALEITRPEKLFLQSPLPKP